MNEKKRMWQFRPLDITVIGMFAALMAIGANITAWAPFLQVGGVPLSMQPFFAILAGLLLGSRLGSAAMIVYMAIGLAGAPVFAKFSGGIGTLFGPTGGFILSFIFVAYIAGKIIENSNGHPSVTRFFTAAFAGIFINYLMGTNYMYLALNNWLGAEMSYVSAWKIMLWFAVKDIAFTGIAAIIAPRIYRVISRSHAFSKLNSSNHVA